MDNRTLGVAILVAALAAGAWHYSQQAAPAPVCPGPDCPVPQPQPAPQPPPRPQPSPWPRSGDAGRASLPVYPVGEKRVWVGGPKHPDGTEVACDLPQSLWQKNTGGSDGAGLCVYASNRHSGLWGNNEIFAGLFQWMRQHPGGSYPSKFTRTLEQYCKEQGKPVPPYFQVESDNNLEILERACASGRMPGVTYGFSPSGRYGGQKISHMVSLVHCDKRWCVILDNNYVGPDQLEWMDPQTFLRTHNDTSSGWATIPCFNPPPPPPKN